MCVIEIILFVLLISLYGSVEIIPLISTRKEWKNIKVGDIGRYTNAKTSWHRVITNNATVIKKKDDYMLIKYNDCYGYGGEKEEKITKWEYINRKHIFEWRNKDV